MAMLTATTTAAANDGGGSLLPTTATANTNSSASISPSTSKHTRGLTLSNVIFNVMFRTERMVARLNRIISVIYLIVIGSLITFMTYMYMTLIHGLINENLSRVYAMLHTITSVYFLISIFLNYMGCIWLEPSISPSSVSASGEFGTNTQVNHDNKITLTRGESWRVCTICNANKPPRTHHCRTCNKCYIRCCHHCPALGKCVARDNYPFFFRFITLVSSGCLFAATSCYYLLSSAADANETNETLVFIIVCSCAISFATGVLSLWHVYLVCTAQTTMEWMDNWSVRRRGDAPKQWGWLGGPFSRDLKSNIIDSFGSPIWTRCPFWFCIIFPFPRNATMVS